jgi:hypothetical protein
MKTQTKRKIVRWVEKLINYDDTKNVAPWKIEQRKIETVSGYHVFTKQECEMLTKEEMKDIASKHLYSSLAPFIRHEHMPLSDGSINTVAQIRVVEL